MENIFINSNIFSESQLQLEINHEFFNFDKMVLNESVLLENAFTDKLKEIWAKIKAFFKKIWEWIKSLFSRRKMEYDDVIKGINAVLRSKKGDIITLKVNGKEIKKKIAIDINEAKEITFKEYFDLRLVGALVGDIGLVNKQTEEYYTELIDFIKSVPNMSDKDRDDLIDSYHAAKEDFADSEFGEGFAQGLQLSGIKDFGTFLAMAEKFSIDNLVSAVGGIHVKNVKVKLSAKLDPHVIKFKNYKAALEHAEQHAQYCKLISDSQNKVSEIIKMVPDIGNNVLNKLNASDSEDAKELAQIVKLAMNAVNKIGNVLQKDLALTNKLADIEMKTAKRILFKTLGVGNEENAGEEKSSQSSDDNASDDDYIDYMD